MKFLTRIGIILFCLIAKSTSAFIFSVIFFLTFGSLNNGLAFTQLSWSYTSSLSSSSQIAIKYLSASALPFKTSLSISYSACIGTFKLSPDVEITASKELSSCACPDFKTLYTFRSLASCHSSRTIVVPAKPSSVLVSLANASALLPLSTSSISCFCTLTLCRIYLDFLRTWFKPLESIL
ncbi:hypothetical protein FC81_GL002091 [Liquorilactobacillus capillatus DSM 19910]|uniref:Uncharacterized protein n=1 Tax=Liquorilactobacillus capillatus DSM 19910 TaxID=1423731 RepID=A0A0R1LYB1_9LACO|nr:hypothetical protein FC81_GL002091 [Liquorilactobacillus capillatus DSM 19910]